MESWILLFSGFLCIAYGVWQINECVEYIKEGNDDRLGNNLVLLLNAIGMIILGLFWIWSEGIDV